VAPAIAVLHQHRCFRHRLHVSPGELFFSHRKLGFHFEKDARGSMALYICKMQCQMGMCFSSLCMCCVIFASVLLFGPRGRPRQFTTGASVIYCYVGRMSIIGNAPARRSKSRSCAGALGTIPLGWRSPSCVPAPSHRR